MASTQTVMWARVLDRIAGPDRPRVVVVDPRTTPTAEAADVHLHRVIALRAGLDFATRDNASELRIARNHPANRDGIARCGDARPQDDAVVEWIAARHAVAEHAVRVLSGLEAGSADDWQGRRRGRARRKEQPSRNSAHAAV